MQEDHWTFERESVKTITAPSLKQVVHGLRLLRSYGRSSFAALTAPDGSWVQVAGGKVTCALERRDSDGRIFRASQDTPVVPPAFEGTELCFGGGRIKLRRHEWFRIEQVIEAFSTFFSGAGFPSYIHWRDVTQQLGFRSGQPPTVGFLAKPGRPN